MEVTINFDEEIKKLGFKDAVMVLVEVLSAVSLDLLDSYLDGELDEAQYREVTEKIHLQASNYIEALNAKETKDETEKLH